MTTPTFEALKQQYFTVSKHPTRKLQSKQYSEYGYALYHLGEVFYEYLKGQGIKLPPFFWHQLNTTAYDLEHSTPEEPFSYMVYYPIVSDLMMQAEIYLKQVHSYLDTGDITEVRWHEGRELPTRGNATEFYYVAIYRLQDGEWKLLRIDGDTSMVSLEEYEEGEKRDFLFKQQCVADPAFTGKEWERAKKAFMDTSEGCCSIFEGTIAKMPLIEVRGNLIRHKYDPHWFKRATVELLQKREAELTEEQARKDAEVGKVIGKLQDEWEAGHP